MYVYRLALLGALSLGLTACLQEAAVETTDPGSFLSPHASLDNLPADPTNSESINVNVTGMLISNYKYRLFTPIESVDCTNLAQYGAEFTSSLPIQDTLTAGDGVYTLCVLAQDIFGNWQSELEPSMHAWRLDTTPPALSVSGQPPATNGAANLAIDVYGTDVVYYKYKFGMDGDTDCAVSTDYSSAISESVNITNTIGGNGFYEICIIGSDDANNWSAPYAYTWTQSDVPTAVLSNKPPALSNAANLNVTVSGTDIVFYKYKLVVGSSCAVGTYSSAIPIATPITDALGTESYTLCVLGQNSVSVWQAEAAVTWHSWTNDRIAPTAEVSNYPTGEINTPGASYNVTVYGTDVVKYQYKIIHSAYNAAPSTDSCNTPVGYSSDTDVGLLININMDSYMDGNYTLCVLGKDAAGNLQSYYTPTSKSWTEAIPALRAALMNNGTVYNNAMIEFSAYNPSDFKLMSFFKIDEVAATGAGIGVIYGGYNSVVMAGASLFTGGLDPRIVSVAKSPMYGGGVWGLTSYGQVVALKGDGSIDFLAPCPFAGVGGPGYGCQGLERYESISVGKFDHLYVLDHEGKIYDVRDLGTARPDVLDPRVKQVSYW